MNRLLNYLKYLYYSFILWAESFGSDAKVNRFDLPVGGEIKETHRRNEKLRRGVKHLVKWMRSLSPEERNKLTEQDNILMVAGRSNELTTVEKMERARAAAKLVRGPRREGEKEMAETFVKNQGKYRLQAQKRNVYKDLQAGKISPKDAKSELVRINSELRKYE